MACVLTKSFTISGAKDSPDSWMWTSAGSQSTTRSGDWREVVFYVRLKCLLPLFPSKRKKKPKANNIAFYLFNWGSCKVCSGSSGTGAARPPAADALTWSSGRAGGPDRSAAFVHPGGTPATPLFLSLSLSLARGPEVEFQDFCCHGSSSQRGPGRGRE